jgi:putative membrane protein
MNVDPGLQPERTALSWDRTTLSLIAGGLVAGRVLPPALGRWALVAGVATSAAGAVLGLIAHRRARGRLRVLLGTSGVLPDGRLPLALAVLVAGVAGGALVAVVLLRAGG